VAWVMAFHFCEKCNKLTIAITSDKIKHDCSIETKYIKFDLERFKKENE
jgi:hypothetical protein